MNPEVSEMGRQRSPTFQAPEQNNEPRVYNHSCFFLEVGELDDNVRT